MPEFPHDRALDTRRPRTIFLRALVDPSPSDRVLVLSGVVLAYVVLLVLGYPYVGLRVLVLSMFPVLAAAGLYGTRAGISAGLIAIVSNAVIAGPLMLIDLPGALEASVALLITGGGTGRLRSLSLALLTERERLREEVRRHTAAATDAQRARGSLRQVVESLPVVVLATDTTGRIELAEGGGIDEGRRQRLLGVSLLERFAARPDIVTATLAALGGKDATSTWVIDDREFAASSAPARNARGEITGLTVIAFDTTEQRKAERALEHMRSHDTLTGLPNRAALQADLERTLVRAPEDLPLALLVLDLDGLKAVNETHGFPAGDAVLVELVRRLRWTLPVNAILGRLDGDAFGVILSQSDGDKAEGVARRMLSAFEQPITTDAGPVELSGTVGVACYPQHGFEADALLRRATIAIDLARATGRRIALYVPERDKHRADRRSMVSELRHAIEADALRLVYQPIVAMSDGRVVAVEALARWPHPDRGLVSPAEFVDLAARSGAIRSLTRWAIRTALADIRTLPQDQLQVSVNLSTENLLEPDLPAFVAAALTPDLGGPRLRLEVTENAVMRDPERATAVLAELRALGVPVAIDDFGTGYSSLAYLERLAVDEIKIDRSFVRELARSADSVAIVRATIQLAHALRLTVIGEGIEGEDTWRILRGLGCDLAQGFYVAAPMGLRELGRWLEDRETARDRSPAN